MRKLRNPKMYLTKALNAKAKIAKPIIKLCCDNT